MPFSETTKSTVTALSIIAITLLPLAGAAVVDAGSDRARVVADELAVEQINSSRAAHIWPECPEEDSPSCVWLAPERENGLGHSVWNDVNRESTVITDEAARDLLGR